MPSFYVIVPYLSYWCNDRPQLPFVSANCLASKPNTNGQGSCLINVPCDQNLGTVCQAVS